MMSDNQGNTPRPIGSFEINPFISKSDTKTESMVSESVDCVINKRCVSVIQDDDANKCANKDITEYVGVHAVDTHLAQVKESEPKVDYERVQDISDKSSPMSSTIKPDVGESKVLGETNLKKKSSDVPDTSSALMMKLAISGPPRCKFDEKKTVLPPSLLQGVTELVKKQQIKALNSGNKDLSVNTEDSRMDGPPVTVFKRDSFKKSFETEKQVDKKTDEERNVKGNIIHKQLNIEELVTDCFRMNKDASLEDTNIYVPVNDNSCTKSRNCVFSESNELHSSVSESSLKEKLQQQDSAVSSEEMCEENPLFEMDVDNLIDDDFENVGTCTDSVANLTDRVGRPVCNNEASSKVLPDSVKSAKRKKLSKETQDNVYDLSALFSGELEQRRKKELKKQKRKARNFERFSKKKKKSATSDEKYKPDSSEQAKKQVKAVPNHFVAIQIKDKQIKSGLEAVQDKVVAENLKLKPAMNKLATLHLTMLVLSLKTDDDMERSKQALEKASEKLLSLYTDVSLTLDVSGLGHFRNNVVFAKVKHNHQVSTLKDVADIVEECFLEQEIISPDQRGFKPHITIMKLSNIKGSKKKGLKKIDEKFYSEFVDTDFGCESIHTLQLCAMMKPKDKLGYYQVEHKVQFAKIQNNKEAPCADTTVGVSNKQGELDQHDNAKTELETEIVTDVSESSVNIKEVIEEKDEKVLSEGVTELSEIDITIYNDSALDLTEGNETSNEVNKDCAPENNNEINISEGNEMSKKGVSKPVSTVDDSALDLSVELESTVFTEKNIDLDLSEVTDTRVSKNIVFENESALNLSVAANTRDSKHAISKHDINSDSKIEMDETVSDNTFSEDANTLDKNVDSIANKDKDKAL